MKLHAIQCANFGGFTEVVCRLDAQSAFFTGANGAGKTTLLDALNTAFTLGGGESKYNAAGSDAKGSRGSTTRNLASYILGSADDGRLREHGAAGHVFVTMEMEPSDKAGGYLHIGCLAQARLSPGGDPELVGEARGVSWISESPDIPRHWIWGPGAHGRESPRPIREFGVQLKADGMGAHVASTGSKSDHMVSVAKHAMGRLPSPEQAKNLCMAMSSTIKIDPEWTSNGFAKKLLAGGGSAFDAESIALLGDAAKSFEAAAASLRVGQAFHDSIQRVDNKAGAAALRSQDHAAALLDLSLRDARDAQSAFEAATAKKAALLAAKSDAEAKLSLAHARIAAEKVALDALAPQISDARAGLGLRGLEENLRLSSERRDGAKKVFAAQAASWESERALAGKRAKALAADHPIQAKAIATWAGTPRPIDGLAEATQALAELASADDWRQRQEDAAATLSEARKAESAARAAFDRLAAIPRGQANAPHGIREAVALINAQDPKANARCLCDVASPKADAQGAWVEAFERLMGMARFTIIVDDGREYDAQRLIQQASAQLGVAVDVARNAKCRKAIPRQFAFKALDMLDFGRDAQALAFAESKFGQWEMCMDGDLSGSSNAFCLDGRTSNPHTLRTSAPAKNFQPCFGSAAAAAAKTSAQSELRLAESALAEKIVAREATESAANARLLLKEVACAAIASSWAEAWDALAEARKAVDLDSQALARAKEGQSRDGSVQRFAHLEEQLCESKSKLALAEVDKDAAFAASARADALLAPADEHLDRSEHERDKRQKDAMQRAADANSWAAATGLPPKPSPSNESGPALARRIEAELATAAGACAAWIEETSRHNNHGWAFEFDPLPAAPVLAASPEKFSAARIELAEALAKAAQKCDAKTQANLDGLRRGVEDMVSSNLCDKAINTVEAMKEQLRGLNDIFETAEFENRHFRLKYSPHDAFAKRLSGFKAIRNSRRPDGSLDKEMLSHADSVQFDTLVDMAKLSHGEALKELSAQCDPVPNGEFDVVAMQVDEQGKARELYSLSKQKTGSGGENQWAFTLLQVLVAASNGGAMGSNGADNPIRVIELDEAFDKLNYDRVNALMRHFEDRLGLQVLAAAPIDKSATLAPLFGRLISVVKPSLGRPGPRPSVAKISSNDQAMLAKLSSEDKELAKERAASDNARALSDAELAAALCSPRFPAPGSPERDMAAPRAALAEAERRAQLKTLAHVGLDGAQAADGETFEEAA